MLKGIPAILPPMLVKILMEMGHGDEIVLADANFPSASIAKQTVFGEPIYLPGVGIPELMEAILTLMPLDYAVEMPVAGMQVRIGMPPAEVHDRYREIMVKYGYQGEQIDFCERFAFYEKAKAAYVVVATGEKARFANLILKKGVISDPMA